MKKSEEFQRFFTVIEANIWFIHASNSGDPFPIFYKLVEIQRLLCYNHLD